jgi:outer membrane protein assembly factor BamB
LVADIKNCRLLRIRHGSHRPAQVFGTTGVCGHRPPTLLGSPNGAFPMPNGNYLVTEIQGSYVDEITPAGRVVWSVHLPGVVYPSDSNQVRPGVYVTVDYSSPGQVLEFNARGRVLWRWRPLGAQRLDHPSLARPLPNGDILVTDDFNHRILVVDPTTNHVVWQYGSTGQAGSAPGLLDNPDGLDVVAPNALINGYPGG